MDTASPLVVAVDMGYGHLRAAAPLAELLGAELLHADRAPLADADEMRLWARARSGYELASRASQLRGFGAPFRALLDGLTSISHLHPYRDLSTPHLGVRLLEHLMARGLGEGLVRELRRRRAPLVTTFYAPAIVADRAGCEPIYCVVTDADVNRIWAPLDGKRSRIQYLVPTPRAEIAHFLGALPERTFEPPQLTFAVGGAGAQADVALRFLPGLRRALCNGRLRLTLVAGVRRDVATKFEEWLVRLRMRELLGDGIDILFADGFDAYLAQFNALLARTDILWTKPSELTFYGALGIPLLLSWPVGEHEKYNRRWAIEHGAGIKQRDPSHAGDWLLELLAEGVLAGAAWQGFVRMPKFGTYRAVELVRGAA
jgi:hypothetical protein